MPKRSTATLKQELEVLQKQRTDIEARIAAIYKQSIAAPAEDKVCPDSLAELLDTPMNFMEFPITVGGIHVKEGRAVDNTRKAIGKFVAVAPIADKTYLGVYLGDIATSPSCVFNPKTGVLAVGLSFHNPAIWVPDLNRIVFGYESWWGVLTKPEDLKQISNADIQNVWYVKALKSLTEGPHGT